MHLRVTDAVFGLGHKDAAVAFALAEGVLSLRLRHGAGGGVRPARMGAKRRSRERKSTGKGASKQISFELRCGGAHHCL